jgi:hypothetical protein
MSVFRQNAVELMLLELVVSIEIALYWTSSSADWRPPDIASNVSGCIKLVIKLVSDITSGVTSTSASQCAHESCIGRLRPAVIEPHIQFLLILF